MEQFHLSGMTENFAIEGSYGKVASLASPVSLTLVCAIPCPNTPYLPKSLPDLIGRARPMPARASALCCSPTLQRCSTDSGNIGRDLHAAFERTQEPVP